MAPPAKAVMRPSEPIRTVGEHVYDVIRERILNGELAPGDPLVLFDLSEALAVSTTPVRAALARLTAEGFVTQPRRRGALTVAPLELEDFEEIQAIRVGLEGFAARLGAEHMNDTALEAMRSAYARLQALRSRSAKTAVGEWFGVEWEMHAACYGTSGRRRLVALVFDYRNRAERYLRLAVGSSPGFQTPLEIQTRLLAACEQRDGGAAEEVIRSAMMWTMEEIRRLLASSDGGGSGRGGG